MGSTGTHPWHCTGVIFATATMVACAGWVTIALWFRAPGRPLLPQFLIALWLLFTLGALLALQRGHAMLALLTFALAMGGVLLWWHSLEPSNDRLWADDVARTSSGEVQGDLVTLSNVRNFDWRSESDYTQRWQTRSYDLRRLQSLDMITSYWAGPAIAHVLLSFGFDDGQYVVFSVEIRRQKGQQFSELGGFFKEFELSVIAADERDVIRVRTNIRGEDDYLYHIRLPLQDIRALFLSYINQANELVHTPRFYNTLTVNCTTLVYHMVERIVGRLPFSYRVVLSGYLPGYVYSVGGLDQRYTLQQLRAFGRITQRAQQSDRSEFFSGDIRQGIPPLEATAVGN
jgi:Domain of unknown function (DUF4105)